MGTRLRDHHGVPELHVSGHAVPLSDCLEPGWRSVVARNGNRPNDDHVFRCFTTRRSRKGPGPSPRGLREASPTALYRWQLDKWAQAPYQYAATNMVCSAKGYERRLVPGGKGAADGHASGSHRCALVLGPPSF